MNRAEAGAFAGLAIFVLLGAGSGNSSRSAVTVKAAVAADCAVQSPQSIDFGTYTPGSNSTVDATADALQIACTKGATGVTIGLDNGQYYTAGHRSMRGSGGSGAVYYEIYTASARNVIWNRTQTVTYMPVSGQPVKLTLYGRVLGSTTSPDAGDYSDTLTALVNF
jgi:spore coat protein U-like protein